MYQKLIGLFKSSSIYTLGNLVNRALFVISMPIMTRYMLPKEYGTLSIINAVVAILMTVFGLGTSAYAMRFYYEYDSEMEKKHLLGGILSYILLFSFLASVFLSLFGETFYRKVFNEISFYPYMILGLWICFISTFEVLPEALFLILNQAGLFIIVRFAKSVLGISLSIISVAVLKMGAEGPLGVSLIVGIFFAVYYLFYLRNKIKLNFSFSVIKGCLKFGLPVLFLLLGRVLLESSDRLILQKFVDLSVVAFYSVGSTIGTVLVMIGSSINSAWIPFFYATAKQEDDSQAKELFSYASTYLGGIILFLGLCATMFRQEIIYVLAPPSYYPVIEIVPFIMIGAAVNALFFIPVRGIFQQKKTGYLPVVVLLGLILNIFLNFTLIPRFQMLGAALATVAASFVMLSACFLLSQKLYFIPYQYMRLLKILTGCVICYGLSILVQGYGFVLSSFLKAIIVMVFPMLLYLIRFFEDREIDRIRHLVTT